MREVETKFIYGMSNFVSASALIFTGVFTYFCWYAAYEFFLDFETSVKETSLGNIALGSSAFFVSTALFLFYLLATLRGGFKKVVITLDGEKITIPNWGWKQKSIHAYYSDITKTKWMPARYGSLLELSFKDGSRVILWSLLFKSLSEYDQFINRIKMLTKVKNA